MKTKRSRAIIPVILTACLVLVFAAGRGRVSSLIGGIKQGSFSGILPRTGGYTKVIRVIDGDTIVIKGGKRVRLIGIDTPESKANRRAFKYARKTRQDIDTIISMGNRAAAFTKDFLEGKMVRLEYDVERYDAYDRLLAYIYLEDGTFVNAEIVRQGYANPLTIPPNVKYAERLHELYIEARENNRGLWSE